MSTSFSGNDNGIQSTLPIPDSSADLDTFWRYAEEGGHGPRLFRRPGFVIEMDGIIYRRLSLYGVDYGERRDQGSTE